MAKIIIADDSDVLRGRLTSALSEIDSIDVIGEVETGNELLAMNEKLNPDVVILDIRMPDGNGIFALDCIKKKKKHPIVIMFTNYPYLQYRKRCFDSGADYFFCKVTEFEKLLETLKKLAKVPT